MWAIALALFLQTPDYQAEGVKALDAQNYTQAADLFSKAIAADPKDYAAHFHLALSYSLLKKDEQAVPEYKSVLELKPGLYEAELNLGITLLHLKQPADALPYLKSASEQRPKEVRAAFYVAEALLASERWPDAEGAYTGTLTLNPNLAAAEAGLGRAIMRQGRLKDAELHYRKAAALNASYHDALLELGEQYETAHMAAEAIAIYHEFPENPAAQERMGALMLESGSATDAISALESAVATSPTKANRVTLAQAYVKNKQPEKAAPLLEQALATDPKDFEVRMFYARLLRDQHKYKESAPQFTAAVELQPNDAKAWEDLAGVLVLAEQYPAALAALDKIRALGAEQTGHFYVRAIVLDKLQQKKEAVEYYQKFLAASQGKSDNEEFIARQRVRILQKELGQR